MRLEKVFNDILGFRMLTDSYASLLEGGNAGRSMECRYESWKSER